VQPRPNQSRVTGTGWLLAVTVFISAFLLFQVQPIISKAILPWFGGTPAVWTTAMFFFQILLLVGYCYAHWSTRYLSLRWQMLIHVGLLLLTLVFLPIRVPESWRPVGTDLNPTAHVLSILARSVGLPFLLLSSTAPLAQVWWHRMLGGVPYRLYAVSNTGSLLALLGYPFLVEPRLGVAGQMGAWSVGYLVVAGLLAFCSVQHARKTSGELTPADDAPAGRPRWKSIVLWLSLSTCGSVLLLAMTNHITQNIAVVPLFWVVPLAIYLITFIIGFAESGLYVRWLFGGLMIISQIACALLYNDDVVNNTILLLGIHLTALFSGCMVCHGELARSKPHAEWLTTFFVIVSIGGALGGFLVSIAAPFMFDGYYEYPLVLIACWTLLFVILWSDSTGRLYRGKPIWAWGLIVVCCFVFLTNLRNAVMKDVVTSFLSRRNFYGILSVQPAFDKEGAKMMNLLHGQILHGAQYLETGREFEPTSYYTQDSGVGYAMQYLDARNGDQPKPKRVAMLGLGVGTIAAYCKPGDLFRVYEINQQVIDIATDPEIFTFWSLFEQRNAEAQVVVGDARLSLENELRNGSQNFDLMVLDVFSGDAIPVHLLTEAAFRLYLQHLADGGMLAIHISNRHLDLLPVVNSTAQRFPVDCAFVSTDISEWMICASPETIANFEATYPDAVQLPAKPSELIIWQDDFSDVFSIVK